MQLEVGGLQSKAEMWAKVKPYQKNKLKKKRMKAWLR
jgi:hypothetical protein